MYNYIMNDDMDRLRTFIEGYPIYGIAHLFFDVFEGDEEVLNLGSGGDKDRVAVSILNPILLCLKYQSISCLRYLVEKFGGVRQSIKRVDIIVRSSDSDASYAEYPFKQWLLPIALKVKNPEILKYLMKQPGFYFTTQDMNSFVSYTLEY